MKHGSLTTYIIGFISSIIFTIAAFLVIVHPEYFALMNGGMLIAILSLAFVQCIVQLIFFLHLGFGTGERWRLIAFFATVGLVFIVVAGSIWIMGHLNYNMTPDQVQQYLNDQQGGF
jgi:cytochrome o ubiquinol oxidase operon protein cyoD